MKMKWILFYLTEYIVKSNANFYTLINLFPGKSPNELLYQLHRYLLEKAAFEQPYNSSDH